MFNNYYASVGVIDNGHTPASHTLSIVEVLETVTFGEAKVIAAIKKLKPNLSSGPDSLPPLFFKKVKYCLAKPLSLLYNQLLSVGFVPDSWKMQLLFQSLKKV